MPILSMVAKLEHRARTDRNERKSRNPQTHLVLNPIQRVVFEGENDDRTPKIKLSKHGERHNGRLFEALYDSSRRETLVAGSVVRSLNLEEVPWKPGPHPVLVKDNQGSWIEVKKFVLVHADVPELGPVADLGTCNFGILPDDIEGLEGTEILVGSRLLERLEVDCGLSSHTRSRIDHNVKERHSFPMTALTDPGEARLQVGAGIRAYGQQQDGALLQLPTYSHSAFAPTNTASVLASGFSSNDAHLVSTPRTSLCETIPALLLPCDDIDPLPQAIDENPIGDWTTEVNNPNFGIAHAEVPDIQGGIDLQVPNDLTCPPLVPYGDGFDIEASLRRTLVPSPVQSIRSSTSAPAPNFGFGNSSINSSVASFTSGSRMQMPSQDLSITQQMMAPLPRISFNEDTGEFDFDYLAVDDTSDEQPDQGPFPSFQ
ncbi:hypothetical protein GQ607_006824 [Colletotrichum asianum]|uniref:Uncharacterized protein n=1 Tax=Colletotrichum asianum TaxID=702518 RepID=A0A8H3ZTQ9_9PEZI|nr:hypothetical protein GQ607_006824 [Colletotrichum asianum]